MDRKITQEDRDDHCAGDSEDYDPNDKCYFCGQMAFESRRVCTDAEPDHDGEGGWTMVGIYSEVLLCEEHLQEFEERLGLFDQYKYGEE